MFNVKKKSMKMWWENVTRKMIENRARNNRRHAYIQKHLFSQQSIKWNLLLSHSKLYWKSWLNCDLIEKSKSAWEKTQAYLTLSQSTLYAKIDLAFIASIRNRQNFQHWKLTIDVNCNYKIRRLASFIMKTVFCRHWNSINS